MENLDIFNLSLDNFVTEEKPKSTNSDLYKTDPKLSKDSIYRAIVRFIPNIKNPKNSIIKKYSYWLENAEGNGFFADCPSSVGEKSAIQDTFWKLYKSESAFDKKQAERIKRKEYHYSYIEIIKDPQRPELEGTVQIFRFPKAIKKIIDSQISPDATDMELGTEPTNIFDFFEGKDFSLKVTLKGGYWNYDECKFSEKITPITLKGSKMENTAEGRNQILSVYEGVQPLEEHGFSAWNDELTGKVYNYLGELTGNPGQSYAATTNYQQPATTPPPATTPTPTATPPATTPPPTDVNSASSDAAKSSDGDIEDWLKEFDM